MKKSTRLPIITTILVIIASYFFLDYTNKEKVRETVSMKRVAEKLATLRELENRYAAVLEEKEPAVFHGYQITTKEKHALEEIITEGTTMNNPTFRVFQAFMLIAFALIGFFVNVGWGQFKKTA